MHLVTDEPNFSILLPGPCNAACEFCFLKNERAPAKPEFQVEYLRKLDYTLRNLPRQFWQISITGGEPTLSPYLMPVLALISAHRGRYTNVVLTTNGTKLDAACGSLLNVVDHVNISMHHYDEGMNQKIFGGSYRMSHAAIATVVDMLGTVGIDASANCVVDDGVDLAFLDRYVRVAQSLGFRAVHFRKRNGTNDPVPAEAELSATYPSDCATRTYLSRNARSTPSSTTQFAEASMPTVPSMSTTVAMAACDMR
jgi:molybdenum cofactor biosynthesis enzyme MoaA